MSEQQPEMISREAVLALIAEARGVTLEVAVLAPAYKTIIQGAADTLGELAKRVKAL